MNFKINSMNPALQRLCMVTSVCVVVSFYTTILIYVGKAKEINLCTSNLGIKNKTCWDWNLNDISRTTDCPFTLVFTGVLLFTVSLSLFLISGIIKCVCPEFALWSYRSSCCKIFTQYYTLVLHLTGTLLILAFIVFVLVYSSKDKSCYSTGDIMKNCIDRRELCWMLCLTCMGFLACLFATMFSAFEARKFNVDRLDDELCDQLYQNYMTRDAR